MKLERRFLYLLICTAALFIPFTATADAQEDVVRVDTTLVTIPTAVMDRGGRYVADLQKDDFEVYEDGIVQEVALFETVDEPFTAMLVFDVSGSMRTYMEDLVRAANAFVTQMRPNDEIIVATFADKRKLNIVVEPVKKRDFKQEVFLNTVRDQWFTATFDAVAGAIDYMKPIKGRRAVVFFTDGKLYGVKATEKSTLRAVEEQDAAFYTIRFGTFPKVNPLNPRELPTEKIKRERSAKSDEYLNALSKKSGGRSFQIEFIEALPSTFRSIADELGRLYYLGYYSQKEEKTQLPRQVKVKVRKPGLTVRAEKCFRRASNSQNSLKRLVETHLAGDGDLIGRDAALEEVRQFLHVLQVHERERILRAVSFCRPSMASRWSAKYSRYCRMSATERPATPPPSMSSANCISQSTASSSIVDDLARRVASSNSSGSSLRTLLHDLEREVHVRRSRRGRPSSFRRRGRAAGRSSAGSRRRRTRRRRTALRCRRQSRSG